VAMATWRLPRGCVLWIDFATQKGATAYDLSGKDNHGTVYGAQWAKGPIAGALNFDGVDDYVDCGNPAVFNITDELSVESLVRIPSRAPATRCFLAKGIAYRLLLGGETLGELGFAINFEDGTFKDLWSGVVPTIDTWYHLVGTYDGKVMKVYVDGDLKKTYSKVSKIKSEVPYRKFLIGWADEWNIFIEAAIAVVRLYNRVLTEREIRAHYWYAKTPIKVPV